jgi:hypothetical protein
MKIDNLLSEFYLQNGLPENGGIQTNTFSMKVFGLNLKFPNPKFRRDALHIHDIQHVLNSCDTSWKGEGFIAGWEIVTGMWKYFPLGFLSLWAMGYSLWIHPKAVLEGFKKGLNDVGIIDIKKTKEEFLQMELEELVRLSSKSKPTKFGFVQALQFSAWCALSQVIFFFPVIVLVLGFMLLR